LHLSLEVKFKCG